ncbi:MAG: amino acid permease [Bacteroidetes bacterium]|nr:amino acid permease [Bacteroidota bacterium]MBU1719939.1 amino acid permease [Bacteroidota bacterium]
MSQVKKFGTFAGVFTPSLLTILGVIMYMRLGWVVGNAGVVEAVGIILIAHIISISTGLSLSSIATDKKIKAGGIYYLLSRSLGLPMGGAIGISIFIGIALSISLYIIGFCESFLSVPEVSSFLGFTPSIDNFRIVGSAVLAFLVVIAFISTSLAIKSQFFILGAIVLSLISIFVGFGINTEFHPADPAVLPHSEGFSFEVLFAVFFPAVTGFTTGAAMSGDLKDPRKALPLGTMLSIGVGLVIYLALAIGLGYFVDRNLLLNDTNFLSKVAWIPFFVILGIWGATLSSALGGVLGAPRILQAVSTDRIAPRIFAKGFGVNNEPRNALIFTFLIAEAGILIGELNVIARVVSMFYIAAYGFINLAYALESWASSDFRPTFRISRWIAVVGFIASFVVMFRIDFFAMIMAFVLMWAMYFFLKRRQLHLDRGDVWQSVWSNIVRHSLHKMDQRGLEERNWKPNIILFSGGTNARPHLLEVGKSIVGNHGFLSNFDLIETQDSEVLFPKNEQAVQTELSEQNKGIFTRKQSCSNLYQGIEMISRTYGFSGVEPNTVMMGWAKQAKDPVSFAGLVKTLSDLDFNVVMVDYDENRAFGKYESIDIWWRGGGQNGNLSLTLVRFMLISEEWRHAKVRLMIVNPVNESKEDISKYAHSILDQMRINAEVRVINNQIERKTFYEIIRTESVNTDLVYIGLPLIEEGKEAEFVEDTTFLGKNIGTVVLVMSSNKFKDLHIGLEAVAEEKVDKEQEISLVIGERAEVAEIIMPQKPELAAALMGLKGQQEGLARDFFNHYLLKILRRYEKTAEDARQLVTKGLAGLEEKLQSGADVDFGSLAYKLQNSVYFRTRRILGEMQQDIENQEKILESGVEFLFLRDKEILKDIPKYVDVWYSDEDLAVLPGDSLRIKLFKKQKRLLKRKKGKDVRYRVYFRDMVSCYYPTRSFKIYRYLAGKWGVVTMQYVLEMQKCFRELRILLLNLEVKAEHNSLSQQLIDETKENAEALFINLINYSEESLKALYTHFSALNAEILAEISARMSFLNVNRHIPENKNENEAIEKTIRQFKTVPIKWRKNQVLLLNNAILELILLSYRHILRTIMEDTVSEIDKSIVKGNIDLLNDLHAGLGQYARELKKKPGAAYQPVYITGQDLNSYFPVCSEIVDLTLRRIRTLATRYPESLELMKEDSFNNFYKAQYSKIDSYHLSLNRILDYVIQTELIEPVRDIVEQLPIKLRRANNEVLEATRLSAYMLQEGSGEFPGEDNGLVGKIAFIKEQQQRIAQQVSEIEKLKTESILQLNERISNTADRLSLYTFLKTVSNLGHYLRKQESASGWFRPSRIVHGTGRVINDFLVAVLYRQSRSINAARRLKAKEAVASAHVNDMLDLHDAVSVKPEVLNTLPFYYQQLFLRKNDSFFDFWVGRDRELKRATEAWSRYKSGYTGALMIIGERSAGKSFLSKYIAYRIINAQNTYLINPVPGGSTSPDDFNMMLANATEISDTSHNILNNLPAGSVILIEDMETWWEKSDRGLEAINEITALIREFSGKIFFIINCNIHSFNIINKISRIENLFLDVIDCESFNAEEIKRIVLFRHKSSGLKFMLGKRSEDALREWHYARLFSKYFAFSKGNVGVALMNWATNVTAYNDGVLTVRMPKIPDLSRLNYLETEWLVLLMQFVLHKQLTFVRLGYILGTSDKELRDRINVLKRAGLINEHVNGVIEVNPFIYPHLRNKMIEKEML